MEPVTTLTLASGAVGVGFAAVKKLRRRQRANRFLQEHRTVPQQDLGTPGESVHQRRNNTGKEMWLVPFEGRSRSQVVPRRWRRQSTFYMQEISTVTQEMVTDAVAYWASIDSKYQRFIQTRLDPLFGRTRDQQLNALAPEETRGLNNQEKAINRRIGFSTAILSTVIVCRWWFPTLLPIAIVLGFLTALPLYKQAYKEFIASRPRRLRLIHLGVLYITAMWVQGYYMVAIVGSMAFHLSRKLMLAVEDQSRQRLINVFGQQPRSVWVRVEDLEMEIPFEQVRVGDTVILNAGEMVPIDGAIIEGIASVDQHMLTGEAQPVEKTVGDSVLAATVVLAGKIAVRVEKAGTETTSAQIGEILNRTASFRLSLESEVRDRGDKTVLPMLAGSLISIPFIGTTQALALAGSNFTIVLIALAPTTMLNFLNIASQQGILVKDGRSLERLDSIDTIVFDKTGTLTLDQPHVARIHTCNGMVSEEVLTLAAAAEYRQTHPIARAILAAAKARQLLLPAIDHAQYDVGYGIKVRLAERLIHVGSRRFMQMEGIEVPAESDALQAACDAQGHSLVLVAVDHELAGGVELQPTVRPEAKRIVQGLQARGLSLYIISGDHEGPTRKLADELGIPGYFANTLPDHKSDLVEQLQQAGRRVCFIGDGINDAIAMRQADVSISLSGATTAATDTAQIVLMDASLHQLIHLLDVAQEFNSTVRKIYRTAVGLSVFCATGILFLHFSFVMTEVLMNVTGLTGLGMAMKPLLDRKKDTQRQQALTEGDMQPEALDGHTPDVPVGLLQEPVDV